MKRYPNPKLLMLVVAFATLSVLAIAFGRLPKAGATAAPIPTCTMNPIVSSNFDFGAESLRQAVLDACPGSTITFDLTGTIQLSGGNILIDKNLAIHGPGASVLTVRNTAAQSATSRIFFVNAGVTATISGLTITGGDVTGDGAGIYNNGTLTINNAIVSNNTMVGDGGGVYNNGTLMVIDSTISSNGIVANSETGTSRVGGGIYNNGTLTVTGSTIHDNHSFPPSGFHFFIGGGIYNAGTANVSNSTFSNNVAGVFNSGGAAITSVPGSSLIVTDSIFDGNLGRTGGLFNFVSTTNITNSTFTNNRGLRGGAIYNLNGSTTVTNSTISNNHIDNNLGGGGGGGGGGIYLEFGTLTLTNSTVSNNRAEGPPITSPNNGAGIYVDNGTLSVTNSTIANNAAAAPSMGGGIYRSSGTVNSRNSIIAGNTASAGRDFHGTLNSQGYNLIGNTANTTISGVTTGNILNQDPLLLALADNGGPTKTLALQPNSPAIDAGDSSGSTTDQRGAVRPSDQAPANVSDGADMGAFEFSPNTTITAHPTDPSNSSSASFSFAVTNGVAFAGFQCRLDNGGFTACASPQTYNSLTDGSHTFTVRAVDNGGNVVGLQPSFTWTIDTVPPQTSLDNNPDNPSAPNVGFRFSGTDSGTGIASFECDLDGSGFAACTSPQTFLGLAQGSHTFGVRAIDAVGNVDPAPASFTWTVDRVCTIDPIVSSRIEGDDGSLRLAVANACAGSTITFSVTGVTTLRGGQITLDKNLTIHGPGAHLLEVRNIASTSRVFLVNPDVTATIAGLTISGGFVNNVGGGIHNSGALTVTNSTIRNNHALNGGGIYNFPNSTLNVANSTIENNEAINGGGIHNATGVVNVTNSTLNNNNVNSAGGGIFNDGILTVGVLTVTNSTISNNTVGNVGGVGGGGIYNNNDGAVNLINSTITNNLELASGASFGGGVNNLGPGTVNCRNTIIAGNTGTFGDFAGKLTSQGYNLIGVTSGTMIVGDTTGNLTGTNARLGPLVFNGGQTMTHSLLSGSPAINAGNTATSPAADQRGAGRVGTADIGAFELNNSANGGNFVATLPDGETGLTYRYVLVANRGAWAYSLTGGALPIGIFFTTDGTIVTVNGTTNESGLFNFTVTGTDGVNSTVTDYSVRFVPPIVNNTAPGMTAAAAISRQQGSAAGVAVTVGTVSDAETAVGNLTVTEVAGGSATGIIISNITNSAGTITAQVSADCNATAGTVRFEVSDGSLTGTADLQVNVTNNTAPTLTYAATSVNGGGATTNGPTTAIDNGSITNYAVQSQGTFTGTISVNSAGVVSFSNGAPVGSHTITIRATDNCSLTTDTTFTLTVNNTPPTFTPASAISVQQGSPAGIAFTVGAVSDVQTAPGLLTVTQVAGGTATGLTISNLTNSAGTITAQVSAECNATAGTVRFQVSDGSLTGIGNLQVNVTGNTAPTLTYAAVSVNGGGATSNSPTTAIDNGSIASYAVQSQSTYSGTISVSSAGVVSISNAGPVGSHTISIRASDNCGLFTDASFTLSVNNGVPTFSPAVAISRQQGSPAGAAVTLGTVSDPQTPAGSLTVTHVAGGTATGITISNITNAAGTITAQVSANCNATAGTVRFEVSDGSLSGTGNLQVNVTNNSAPTLTYAAASVSLGGSTTNSSTTATDNGSIASFAVQSQGTYTGSISVSAAGVVSLSNAGPAGNHTITIRATDDCGLFTDATFTFTVNAGALQFSAATYNVIENGGPAVVTVTRTGNTANAATVQIASSNGTATAGTDYTTVSQTLTFNDGESSKTVNVPITDNLVHQPNRTINLTLSNVGGSGTLGAQLTAVLTILDDDPNGGYIKFSAPTYDVSEVAGSATITVERLGTLSEAVTVDYATTDDSNPPSSVPCDPTPGNAVATSRCDFNTTVGRLSFKAGDGTPQTFTVLINEDPYLEGPETLLLTLSALTGGATFATPSTATLTITDSDLGSTANTIDDPATFVRQHFRDFVNREPDAAGLAFWTNEITSCGVDVQCIEAMRVNVSAAFFLSTEFQVTGGTAYLTNRATYVGFPNFLRFQADAQAIGRNYVQGQPGSEGLLEVNKVAYFNEFVSRSEFVNAYGGLGDQAFINKLISNTGIFLTQLERDAWLNGLSSHTETRATVLRKLTEHASFVQAEANNMFVMMEYFGYLRRNPDQAGFKFWANKLDQFDGNFVNAEMVKAFINSSEYRQRFGR